MLSMGKGIRCKWNRGSGVVQPRDGNVCLDVHLDMNMCDLCVTCDEGGI